MSGLWLPRESLLNGLLIGIAPGADLQPAADPAQALRRVGCANGPANGTLLRSLGLIGHHGKLGLIQQLWIDHRLRDRGLRMSRWLPFHGLKTTVSCWRLRCAVHPHDISRIQSSRAPRALLTGLHLGCFGRGHHDSLHRVRADGTVNECLGLVLWDRLLSLGASLNVHASSFLNA